MFNEMLLECCKNLKSVKLVTKNVDVTALEDLSRLSLSLENRGIEMNIVEQQLHDREIRYYIFSFAFYRTTIFEKKHAYSFLDANKIERWIVTLGRGLDFYHPPNNKFEIGAYNFRFRPCKATNITFHKCFWKLVTNLVIRNLFKIFGICFPLVIMVTNLESDNDGWHQGVGGCFAPLSRNGKRRGKEWPPKCNKMVKISYFFCLRRLSASLAINFKINLLKILLFRGTNVEIDISHACSAHLHHWQSE